MCWAHCSKSSLIMKIHISIIPYSATYSFQVQVLPPQQLVHQADYLQNQLVLTEVVSNFEDGWILGALLCHEGQPGWHQRGLEEGGLLCLNTTNGDAWVKGKWKGVKGCHAFAALFSLLPIGQELSQPLNLLGPITPSRSRCLNKLGEVIDESMLSLKGGSMRGLLEETFKNSAISHQRLRLHSLGFFTLNLKF